MSAPIEIQTEREGVVLRQLSSPADDIAYHRAYNASRAAIEAFEEPEDHGKYQSVDEVREARENPLNPDKLRFGVWGGEKFVVSINLTPDPSGRTAEVGYWADTESSSQGYTTLATRALATFALSRFPDLSANVVEGNQASVRVLEKSGFRRIASQAGQLAFTLSGSEYDRPLKSRAAGIIFYVESTGQLMFFQRDDKPDISCPGMIDIIGGHMEDGEEPKETALREIGEELVDDDTGEPLILDANRVEHFKTFVDGRPGEHNIFVYRLDRVPNFHTNEGQGLVFLTTDEARRTNFAYGYNRVVNELLDSFGQ